MDLGLLYGVAMDSRQAEDGWHITVRAPSSSLNGLLGGAHSSPTPMQWLVLPNLPVSATKVVGAPAELEADVSRYLGTQQGMVFSGRELERDFEALDQWWVAPLLSGAAFPSPGVYLGAFGGVTRCLYESPCAGPIRASWMVGGGAGNERERESGVLSALGVTAGRLIAPPPTSTARCICLAGTVASTRAGRSFSRALTRTRILGRSR